uniref:ABC-type xenobiotic transporter n=1 Tax=Steinernema glaseri TaxID=37863 RepID=A0A1I8A8S6_9BILA
MKGKFEAASFRDMLRYADRTDWLLLVCGILCCAITGAIAPLGSVLFRGITDTLIAGQRDYVDGTLDYSLYAENISYYAWLYFGLGVLMFLVSDIAMSCLFTVCQRQVHEIRKRFFSAIMKQDMEWFDHNEVGALTHRMSAGIDRIKDGMGDKCGVLLQACANFVSGIIIGFCLSWKMTLVMLIVVPFVVASLYASSKILSHASRKEMSAYAAAGAIADEVFGGIRTVMSFNAQLFEIDRYAEKLKYAREMGIRKATVTGIFTGAFLFILFGSMSIAFWFGTTLVMSGDVSPGTVFGVFWAVLLGAMRLGQAVPQISVIVAGKLSAGEIFSIIDRKPKIDCTSKSGMTINDIKGKISFSNVHFHYPTRPNVKILNGVSYDIEPGQTVALVGHSGCGKSTMIGLLLRYYEQESGTVTIDGVPLDKLNVEWIRNTIGIVSQEPILFATTIENNLRMGKTDLTEQEMVEACQMANAHEFISRLPMGYKTIIGEGGVKLSGGQKQRIAIARALVRNPKILLLDEATSALDTESEAAVQKALESARHGRTTVTIAHRLSTVRTADKIIVFDHGNIVESGTHEQLMEMDAVYRQLVKAQEIEEGAEDTVIDDVDPSAIDRAGDRHTGKSRRSGGDSYRKSVERQRMSAKLRASMTNSKGVQEEIDSEIEEKQYELEDEGEERASLADIFRFSRPEMPLVGCALIATVIRGLSWPVFSIIYGKMFLALSTADFSTTASDTIVNSISFMILAIVSGASTFSSGTLFGTAGERMTMRLRVSVYKNLLRQDGAFFDKAEYSVGKLSTRLATDAPNVQAAIDQRLAEVLQGVVSLIAGVCIAFYFGWNMAPIGVATAVTLVILQSLVSQYLKFRGVKDNEVAQEASQLATESIEHVRTIQALAKQEFMYGLFCKASERPHKRAIIRGLWQSVSYAMSSSFYLINFGIAYRFGLWLVLNNYTTPFVVFQVIEALNMASMTVLAAASYFPEYLRARLSAGLLFGLMNKKSKIDNMSEEGAITEISGNIALRDVYFAYPNMPQSTILNGLSLQAGFGQTVALVGPSGCGKSTVIQLVERYYDTLGGKLEFDGHDVRSINIRHLRSHIALVGQEPTLFNLSIRDNITYGMSDVSDDKVIEAAKLANIHSFVDSLPDKYDTNVGAKGSQLSGGQKQRIAIARAIIRNPRILLLDEATSALDTESEKVVQEALDKARMGRTCLVVAHRLSTIQNADLIVVAKDGRVIEMGNHLQLLARKGLYYRLVEKQKIA